MVLMVLTTQCQETSHQREQSNTDTEARITMLISKAKVTDPDSASIYLNHAYKLTRNTKEGPIAGKYLWKIAYQAFRQKDSSLFKEVNRESLTYARKVKDTFALGHSHWNYGAWYLSRIRYDSAYYHYGNALRMFENSSEASYSGQILYNMGIILSRLKDYTGAEVLAFRAIAHLEPQQKHKQLYLCYNLLGVIYEELSEYDKAIIYHTKALEYLEHIKDPGIYLLDSQNNIGLIYQKTGDQKKAITYFDQALNAPFLKQRDVSLYARLLDNKAFSRLLNKDTVGLLPQLNRALYLRDSISNKAGVVVSKLHLASYYAYTGDTIRGIQEADGAYGLAQKIRNNRDILLSLLLLADLDISKRPEYLRDYISLNQELIQRERQTRNKFTRIQYETNKYMQRSRELSVQNAQIFFIASSLVLIFALLYFYYRQRARTKVLQLESAEQKANEKIYLLTIKQHTRFQEGKIDERIRISEMLHDSVVADLYGIRLNWGYLQLYGDKNEMKKHREYLTVLKSIENQIRDASHSLRENLTSHAIDFFRMISILLKNRGITGGFKTIVEADPRIDWRLLDDFVRVNLYCVIEEALQNCIKHARAKTVNLQFSLEEGFLIITLRDDGIGMSNKRIKGIGLKNIWSRTRKMKGTVSISSIAGEGTTLTVAIPYKTYKL